MDKEEFMKKYKMRELTEKDGIEIELIYTTQNNFTNEILYEIPICMLREKTAEKLLKANNILKDKGMKIKVWDSFRPYKYQIKMWDVCPDEKFVANPKKQKCNHCKGSAVDITLCTLDNKELRMPTEFDHFGVESYRDYYDDLKDDIKSNVLLLENTMVKCGFSPSFFEWWHFNDIDDYDVIYEMFK